MTLVRSAVAAVLLALSLPAPAGQPCLETPATPEAGRQSAHLASLVREQLERSQLSVAFIARIGLDMSEYGLRYTHVAVAWRDHPRGRWYTFHLLNKCGTGESILTEQALEDFFQVHLHAFEALIAAPSFPLQLKVQKAFFGPAARELHEPQYNLISHPYSTLYQNSNQWVLEVLASALAAQGSIKSRKEAQAWLRDNLYIPSEIAIPRLRRMGAWMVSPHVRFSDHTDDEGRYNRYVVVSAESMLRFLERIDPGLVQTVVKAP